MRPLPVPLLLLALGVAGCGGDPLTRAEYVEQGNAICVEAQRDIDALGRRDLPPEELGPKAAEIGDRQVEDLLALEPPESLAPQRARLEELVDEVRELGREAAGGDASGVGDRIAAKSREAERVLGEMGLEGCTDG